MEVFMRGVFMSEITVCIDVYNLMYSGYHATKKANLSTKNYVFFEGSVYDSADRNSYYDGILKSYDVDKLVSSFNDDGLVSFLRSKGFKKGSLKSEFESLRRSVLDYHLMEGEYSLPTGALLMFSKKVASILGAYPGKIKRIVCCWDNRTSKNAVGGINEEYIKYMRENKPEILAEREASARGTEYKSGRPQMPSDLSIQLSVLPGLIESLPSGINLNIPGYEADDILSEVAKHFESIEGECACIVTKDKDLWQCIRSGNFIISTMSVPKGKAFRDIEAHDSDVVRKFGVGAEYVPDYLAITGDSVDNVHGIHGVGPEKAKQLINKFGHCDQIISGLELLVSEYGSPKKLAKAKKDVGLDKMTEKTIQAMLDSKEELDFFHRMVMLDRDCGIDINDLDISSGTIETFKAECKKFGLNSVLRDLNRTSPGIKV